jgi:lysozyme
MLIRHEGMRLRAYLCSKGKITIGVGRNLEDRGITEAEAHAMLDHDLEDVCKEAERFTWYATLSPARQDVIVSMLFNLGLTRFLKFKNLIEALRLGQFEKAAAEMLDSDWHRDVKGRAEELAALMKAGVYP